MKGLFKKNWQEEAAVATVNEKEKKKNRGRELLVIVYL